jgi:hypothetical protein
MNDRYYVLWPDGQRFGPADLPTLQRWAVENRIGPGTLLEEVGSGRHLRATDVPALRAIIPLSGPGPQPGHFVASNPQSGTTEVVLAWVLGALGLVCCGVFASVGGIVCAAIAQSKRQPNATAALIFNIVVLGLTVVGCGVLQFMDGPWNF